MRSVILWVGLVGLFGPAWGQYKCTGPDGRVSFQQVPCSTGGRAERLQLRDSRPEPDPVTPAASGAPAQSSQTGRKPSRDEIWLKSMERERRLREIDQEIDRERNAVSSRAGMMEREMAALRAKKASANNNLAGATWEQSISAEMQAVAQKYRALNEISTERLKALAEERKDLARPQP